MFLCDLTVQPISWTRLRRKAWSWLFSGWCSANWQCWWSRRTLYLSPKTLQQTLKVCYTALMIAPVVLLGALVIKVRKWCILLFYLLFFRVHEDNRHLLLPCPVLSSVGLWNLAAQSGLRVRGVALLRSLRGSGVAEVRLPKDSRGETPTCVPLL